MKLNGRKYKSEQKTLNEETETKICALHEVLACLKLFFFPNTKPQTTENERKKEKKKSLLAGVGEETN